MTDPVLRTALSVDLLVSRLSAKALELSTPDRDAVLAAMSAHSPAIRLAFRRTRRFRVWFVVGVLLLLSAVLTSSAVPLILGTVVLGWAAIRQWRVAWQALDLVIGTYLVGLEE